MNWKSNMDTTVFFFNRPLKRLACLQQPPPFKQNRGGGGRTQAIRWSNFVCSFVDIVKKIYKKVSCRIFSVNSLTCKHTNLCARTLTLLWLSITRKKDKGLGFIYVRRLVGYLSSSQNLASILKSRIFICKKRWIPDCTLFVLVSVRKEGRKEGEGEGEGEALPWLFQTRSYTD